MQQSKTRIAFIALGVFTVSAIGVGQLKQILKIVGVGAAVKQFGPDINRGLNKLIKHTDTPQVSTKVVPIISAGINSRQAIGAAQVKGPKKLIDKVNAVARLDQDLFGREIKIQAMVPVEKADLSEIKPVEGVGVSGIVDLKL